MHTIPVPLYQGGLGACAVLISIWYPTIAEFLALSPSPLTLRGCEAHITESAIADTLLLVAWVVFWTRRNVGLKYPLGDPVSGVSYFTA